MDRRQLLHALVAAPLVGAQVPAVEVAPVDNPDRLPVVRTENGLVANGTELAEGITWAEYPSLRIAKRNVWLPKDTPLYVGSAYFCERPYRDGILFAHGEVLLEMTNSQLLTAVSPDCANDQAGVDKLMWRCFLSITEKSRITTIYTANQNFTVATTLAK